MIELTSCKSFYFGVRADHSLEKGMIARILSLFFLNLSILFKGRNIYLECVDIDCCLNYDLLFHLRRINRSIYVAKCYEIFWI